MKEIRVQRLFVCVAACLFACAVPARAVAPSITFVSATGHDTGVCPQTAPCATIQYAINQTAAGGEVDALTAGNFGSFVINNSITIDGKGLASVNVGSGQAIAVNEYSITDTVVLRGLTIVGDGTGVEGVYYPGGGSLVVDNCVINGFTYDGIVNVTNGSSLLIVKNTTINGGIAGVYVNEDGGSTILDHVTISGVSSCGIEVLNSPGTLVMNDSTISGGNTSAFGVDIQSSAYYGSGTFHAMLERDTITGTTNTALYVGVGNADVDSSTFFANSGTAMAVSGSDSAIRASNNNIYSNGIGISCPSGAFATTGNNRKASDNTTVTCGSSHITSITLQ